MKRKDREQAEARRLRAGGVSVREIAARLGVSLSSASVWTRDVEVPVPPAPAVASDAVVSGDVRTRRCGRCRQTLPLAAFNRAGDGHQHWCRECFRAYFRDRGDKHRAAVRAARSKRRAAAREFLVGYLAERCCVDCGEDERMVLEFDHHTREKTSTICDLVNEGCGIAKLQRELDRCEVVCANCHRRRTAHRGAFYRLTRAAPPYWTASQRRNRDRLLEMLSSSACVDCGERDPLVLDFDHRGDKRAPVTRLANDCSARALEAEIAKCDVRCANCHAVRTRGSGTWRGPGL